jgi:hypothetical protein
MHKQAFWTKNVDVVIAGLFNKREKRAEVVIEMRKALKGMKKKEKLFPSGWYTESHGELSMALEGEFHTGSVSYDRIREGFWVTVTTIDSHGTERIAAAAMMELISEPEDNIEVCLRKLEKTWSASLILGQAFLLFRQVR